MLLNESQLSIVDIKRETDLAWAAGIVDGEGTITRRKGSSVSGGPKIYTQFRLALYQSSNNGPPEVLTRFRDIFSCGSICSPQLQRYKLNEHIYQVYGDNARQILRLIWPYLGTVKKEQAYKAGFKLNSWE